METNANILKSGILPSTIGSFVTIPNPPKGGALNKRRKYLDKVNMDIVVCNYVYLGGHQYDLLLVEVSTRYCWLYVMSSLS